MTDKQMEDKKRKFMKMFAEPEYFQLETNEFTPNGEYGNFLGVYTPNEVWQWISKLVEEVVKDEIEWLGDELGQDLLLAYKHNKNN